MKKFILAAVSAIFLAAPAYAGSMTIEFAPEDGDKVTIILDSTAQTATIGDQTSPYSWDETGKTLCGGEAEQKVCVTFDEVSHDVGFTTGYTRNDGVTGTATVISVTE